MAIWNVLKNLYKDTSGQISVIACVAALPLIGAVGAGVDYSFLASSRAELQKEADVLALERRGGRWINETLYQVDKDATVDTYFMGIVGQKQVKIGVTAQVKTRMPTPVLKHSTIVPLGGNSFSYNVTGAYCYNLKTKNRHSFVEIADNRNKKIIQKDLTCEEGEEINFYLISYLVITYKQKMTTEQNGSRTNYKSVTSALYSNQYSACSPKDDIHTQVYWHSNKYLPESVECNIEVFFSDAGNKNNEKMVSQPVQDAGLESIIMPCNTSDGIQCIKNAFNSSKIPKGSHRTPITQLQNCTPGQVIYLGWADQTKNRQTKAGGFLSAPQFDYNDLQMAFDCPDNKKVVTYLVR